MRETNVSEQLRPTLVSLAIFTVLTGVAYPLAMTGVAQVLFPHQANGSIITEGGRAVGSDLIGQPFDDPRYFWGRPSATSPACNGAASSGSNLGPLNPDLKKQVQERIRALRAVDPGNTAPVPVDLVTTSGSGLDPHISLAAAEYQADRVARIRGLNAASIRKLIAEASAGRQLGVLGEPVVNVVKLNLALDKTAASSMKVAAALN